MYLKGPFHKLIACNVPNGRSKIATISLRLIRVGVADMVFQTHIHLNSMRYIYR